MPGNLLSRAVPLGAQSLRVNFKGPLLLAVNFEVPKARLDKMENFVSTVAHLNLVVTENNPDLLF